MSKLVACYKVHRGGEWFEASLESVRQHTDGAVVVSSEGSWVSSDFSNNCHEPLARFYKKHPDYPVIEMSGDFRRGEPQYDIALAAIREDFGEDASALIVDSDEVWESEDVAKVRCEIEAHPECHYFRAGLYTYLRSPLYQVWPPEPPNCCVAIRHCSPQEVNIRFATQQQGTSRVIPDVRFHHFTYVRENLEDIALKFRCTSAQELRPSKDGWLDTVWSKLPQGRNLHMTPGFGSVWKEIKVLPKPPILLPDFCATIVRDEGNHWRQLLEADSPQNTLIPVPTLADLVKYPEVAEWGSMTFFAPG